jgi:hypothetical protein
MIMDRCEHSTEASDDGVFCIRFVDLCLHFRELTVCKFRVRSDDGGGNAGWHESRFVLPMGHPEVERPVRKRTNERERGGRGEVSSAEDRWLGGSLSVCCVMLCVCITGLPCLPD